MPAIEQRGGFGTQRMISRFGAKSCATKHDFCLTIAKCFSTHTQYSRTANHLPSKFQSIITTPSQPSFPIRIPTARLTINRNALTILIRSVINADIHGCGIARDRASPGRRGCSRMASKFSDLLTLLILSKTLKGSGCQQLAYIMIP
jgi:hypothetical protein